MLLRQLVQTGDRDNQLPQKSSATSCGGRTSPVHGGSAAIQCSQLVSPAFSSHKKNPPRNGEGLGIQIIRYLLFFDRGLFYNSAVLVSAAKVLVFCKNSAHRDNVTHIGHFL